MIEVIKHADACASVASHEMMVVPNTDALKSCKPPVTFERDTQVICQQFIPHGTHLFKVYVIGEHVHVQQRPSLSLSGESFAFNSQHLPKTFDDDEVHAHEETTDHGRAAERGIHTFARCIREECDGQLSLFGFDVVVSENDPSSAFVVDLNYFPGFEGVPEFNEWFLEHLWEVNRRAVARQ